ncbi:MULTISPECIES: hypothetical protein [unclassified Cryobacterium]|uniref:hypothetical protein n=1 Tax=unclassified Cryobacterium TaxID=2649013 RepID=UPI00106BEA42|nr:MULTISPECIES: hypothetical protein [unclassified Cryobacterium]TFB96547.1 hypothetical protein E3O39_10775 [Cryobacterium sp. MDB2-A-1]TFC12831.1 hypothetical protein E3O35_07935 [Cryobacterium sp. MDB2-A-2]
MNMVEVGQVLTIASGFDRFITVDRVTTSAWFLVLSGVDFEEAKVATVAHFIGPQAKEIFSVRHILAAVADAGRNAPAAIEADVRSAKARGLVAVSWPSRERLPELVRDALFTLRERERRSAAEMFDQDQIAGSPVDVGTVGRRA